MKTSDQACPRYILDVLMQNSGGPPRPYQFIEIGQHWNRLAKKKVMVHMLQIPIIVQTAILNGSPLKILQNPFKRLPTKVMESLGVTYLL